MSDMNRVELIGRVTRDPDIRQGNGDENSKVAKYTLAVGRRGQAQDGKPNADFISCVAFGRSATFAERFLRKGTKIGVCGHIQTGSYTNKDGVKVYTTDVVIEDHTFCEKVGSEQVTNDFEPAMEQELPFK